VVLLQHGVHTETLLAVIQCFRLLLQQAVVEAAILKKMVATVVRVVVLVTRAVRLIFLVELAQAVKGMRVENTAH
jgi:hypothetical protein